MKPILVLWATPRSTSTAFEWMMRTRGDFDVLHEPFGQAYYFGTDRRTTRPDENPLKPEISYASIWSDITARAATGPVFMKDFPNYVMHMTDGAFLDRFRHTFLIRHPRQVLTSMYAHWNEFTLDETSFAALHEMFDRVVDRYGDVPTVVDSDDLLADPAAVTEAYCDAVGIPFLPDALAWEEGDRDEVTWYGGTWHAQLQQSRGFAPQVRRYADLDDIPFLEDMYERCLPHYEALYSHRIAP
ncbi:MAG: sulfotransferase family protein [Acidimicrobiia bacterium]|nr:sulfotransferase family protein [Acidimicrobiia bacterium]